ncbi:MAG: hypothetical protein JNM24_15920 [Bdellovibrionaceae bacterium]|nr:hypothetical protein [Pseudobdellovibrionaceae bacterium]MBP9707294.1 hypothetical protein [Oligoflexales bacterium]
MKSNIDCFIRFSKLLVLCAAICGISYWRSQKIPTRFVSLGSLQKEPVQIPTTKTSFTMEANGHRYQLNPTHDYEIWGLVVSNHDSDSWTDTSHESWNDYINTKDICVIWGTNILNPYLDKLNFRNGNWTCYVQTKSGDAWQKFQMDQMSNNHLIPANINIQKLIENSKVGDEIRIKGHLVNYSVDGGPYRNTSVSRADRENGACEIIYVNEFETLARNNTFWIKVFALSKLLCVALLVAAILSLFVAFYQHTSTIESSS